MIARATWWETFFDEAFAELYLDGFAPEPIDATVAFLVSALGLSPGDRVFDQGCGLGRLALPLAARGLAVVGVDQSAAYVARAQESAAAQGLACAFATGDAFTFVARPACRGAFNWATSFGFAEGDEQNVRMLRRAYESLAPGGRFALDYMNVPRVLRDLQRCLMERRGEALILRETRLDLPRGLCDQTWTYVLPDGRRHERRGTTRLYMPHELAQLLRAAGFADVSLHGGVRGEALALDSARCVAVASRPA